MTSRRLVAAALAVLGLSCAGQADDGHLIHPPPPDEGVIRFYGPEFDVQPGEERFICYTIQLGNTQTLYIGRTHAFQSMGGHHALVLSVLNSEATTDAPHECTGADMALPSIHFVGAGTAAGDGIALPTGMALPIEPGRKLLVQAHYLNVTTGPVRVQDAIDLLSVPEAQVVHQGGAYTQADGTVDLPPHVSTTRSISCTVPVAMNVPLMFPHMHEWGAHARIELTRAGTTTTLYDGAWDPTFRDHFPIVNFDPPLALTPEDRLTTTCTWNNTESDNLIFPREMCASFMPYYPSNGAFWVCDESGANSTL